MTIAVCLLLYSLVVLVLGPPVLKGLTRRGSDPRLGVAVWMTAIGSVLVSWLVSATLALAELAHHWTQPDTVFANCLAALRSLAVGNAGTVLQVGLLVLAGMGAAAMAISVGRLLAVLRRMRGRTHTHANAVRVVGRRINGIDAVVLDAVERAAYCVPGCPDAVVVTSAAVDALTQPQLAAIIAHERAHLDGRHPQLVAVVRGLAAIFPNLKLISDGAHHISRLLEMRADDKAAREHGAAPILGGLLALTAGAATPSGALAASGVAVLARAERLAFKRRAGVAHTVLIAAVLVLVAAGPLATGVLAAYGALLCGG